MPLFKHSTPINSRPHPISILMFSVVVLDDSTLLPPFRSSLARFQWTNDSTPTVQLSEHWIWMYQRNARMDRHDMASWMQPCFGMLLVSPMSWGWSHIYDVRETYLLSGAIWHACQAGSNGASMSTHYVILVKFMFTIDIWPIFFN
jgi:hypothetical protein